LIQEKRNGLSRRIETVAKSLNTIFEIIMFHEIEPFHYDGMGGWETRIKQNVPDATTKDVLAVFKRLHDQKLIELTNAGVSYRRVACNPSLIGPPHGKMDR
jgi:hypothetical protein